MQKKSLVIINCVNKINVDVVLLPLVLISARNCSELYVKVCFWGFCSNVGRCTLFLCCYFINSLSTVDLKPQNWHFLHLVPIFELKECGEICTISARHLNTPLVLLLCL